MNRPKKRAIGPEHVTDGPVFRDVGFSEEEAAVLLVKSGIHRLLLEHIRKTRLGRRELEGILGEPQPRVSELMTGKIGGMSIERLLRYARRLGLKAQVSIRPTRRAA